MATAPRTSPFPIPRAGIAAALACLLLAAPARADAWRVDGVRGLPEWLSLDGTVRVRYEVLDEQFRASLVEDDQVLVARTLLHGRARWHDATFGIEVEDSRQAFADRQTPLDTTVVDTLEILRGYVRWETSFPGREGSTSDLTAGRLTMDVGSRRFVARNRFRNTINAFTGVDWTLGLASGRSLRAFYTLPVRRLPSAPEDLLDNRSELDDQDVDVRFWGVHWSDPELLAGDAGEVFLFGLDENDGADGSSRQRDLVTAGIRLRRAPARGARDHEIEGAYQSGRSRPVPTATGRLDHSAWFVHGEIGHTFDRTGQPRLALQFDYASGDRDPSDGRNERFDTLFGARRFDFGPTGVYGAFARGNLVTPGVRLEFRPGGRSSVFVAHRTYWLASARDSWTTSGVVDPTGASGRFLGQQIEGSFAYEVLPGNLEVETGAAYLFRGSFARHAPNANGNGDPAYVYAQGTLRF